MKRPLALIAILPIKIYQQTFSPALSPRCKYYPSCSEYAIESLTAFGLVKGLAKTAWRLLRCNPWSLGGVDYAVNREFTAERLTKKLARNK